MKKKKENIIKKKEEKHDILAKKENGIKKSTNSSANESSASINKATAINDKKTQTSTKRNCLSAASSSSFSSTSTNSTSESIKNLSSTQRAVHRKYCEVVKLKNQKKQFEEKQGQQNNINSLKLFFKDKVILLNIGTLTGKYFQIEAFCTDTIADLKEIIQDKEGINKESQILIYQGKSLINDNYTLSDYNLKDGATLKLALQMSGG